MYIKKYLSTKDVKDILRIKQPYIKNGFMGYKPIVAYYEAAKNNEITGLFEDNNLVGYLWQSYLKRTSVYRIIEIVCLGCGCDIIENKKYIVDVVKNNLLAVNFYKKLGFFIIKEKVAKNGIEIYIMKN